MRIVLNGLLDELHDHKGHTPQLMRDRKLMIVIEIFDVSLNIKYIFAQKSNVFSSPFFHFMVAKGVSSLIVCLNILPSFSL